MGTSLVVSARMLLLGLPIALVGCYLPGPRPDDLVYVSVSHLPPDSRKVLFVARLKAGLKRFDWYESGCTGWNSSPMHADFEYANDKLVPLKHEDAIMYGVLVCDSRRIWRVWWFGHTDVLGIPPDPETGSPRWKLDLTKAREIALVSQETLQWLGIGSRFVRPRWTEMQPSERLTWKDGRMPNWLVEKRRSELFKILDEAANLATSNLLVQAASKCEIILDALEEDLRSFPKWTHTEGSGLELTFAAFQELGRAASDGNREDVLRGILRMREGLTPLQGSDESRPAR